MTAEDLAALDKVIGYSAYSMRPPTHRQWGLPGQYLNKA